MVYFPDLAPIIEEGNHNNGLSWRRIGWLDRKFSFPKSDPSKELLDAAWKLCETICYPTRGLHICDLCKTHSNGYYFYNNFGMILGSGAIAVFNKRNSSIYISPNLIFHYIMHHDYCPPKEFQDSIILEAHHSYDEYRNNLGSNHIPWEENKHKTHQPEQIRIIAKIQKQ